MRVKSVEVFIAVIGIIACLSLPATAAPPTYTISGVIATADGISVEGVDIIGDNGAGADVTAADGSYSIIVPKRWDGTISVSKTGWLITPESKSYENVTENIVGQHYIAYQPTINGVVQKEDGSLLAGAIVTANNDGGSNATDPNGYYEIIVPYNWSGTVSANLTGYGFTDQTYTNVIVNQIDQDYIGFQPVISGYIKDTAAIAMGGVTVNANDGEYITQTDSEGYYEIQVPFEWTGIVKPKMLNYSFDPRETNYSNVEEHKNNQDYIATEIVADGKYGGGNGSEDGPYQIWSAEQMNEIGLHPKDWDKHFILMNDIDMSAITGDSYNIIGNKIPIDSPNSFVLDETNSKIYWSDSELKILMVFDLVTSKGKVLKTFESDYPYGMTLSQQEQKLYWITYESHKLQKANLDGTGIEDILVEGISTPSQVAVDAMTNRIYWADQNSDKILYIDPNALIINELPISGLQQPMGLTIDQYHRKLYWLDPGFDTISRANMDGTEVEEVISSDHIRSAYHLSIDTVSDKLYWTDGLSDNIMRANLDGSNIETVLYVDNSPTDILVDSLNGKIYWNRIYLFTKEINCTDIISTSTETIVPLKKFSGTFDGNYNEIQNFTYVNNDPNYNYRNDFYGFYTGLFGYIDGTAELKNLTLRNPYIQVDQQRATAALAGFAYQNATVQNCNVYNATIISNGQYVGALVGYCLGSSCTIQDCNVTGSVRSGSQGGGLVGRCYGKIYNCQVNGDIEGASYIGGVIGLYNGIDVQNCSFSGIATGSYATGGLIGRNESGVVVNCYAEGTIVGGENAGVLMGSNYARVENCYATGYASGFDATGGLIGADGGFTYHSYANCEVVGDLYVGGLCGQIGYKGGTVGSFSVGTVIGNTCVGGLVGQSNAEINSCYSTCSVDGTEHVGGLVGENLSYVIDSYSIGPVAGDPNVGGLVGTTTSEGEVYSSYWNIDTSLQSLSPGGGTGKTTEELMILSTYAGWSSCNEVEWTLDEGVDYPHFLWEGVPGELLGKYQYGGGQGTLEDPYLLYSAEQFNMIGKLYCDWDKHFILMSDIDLSGIDPNELLLIGEYDEDSRVGRIAYSGFFDGNGHVISGFKYHTAASEIAVGLFKYVNSEGVIKDLGLENVDVFVGNKETGQLAGRYIGGLVGIGGTVLRCYVTGSVSGGQYVGGIGGSITLEDCYSDVQVTANSYAGGITGQGNIINCYATGLVSAASCAGGLCGYLWTAIESSLWNLEATGQVEACGFVSSGADASDAYGKTTAEMLSQQTYINVGFDFDGLQINGPNNSWLMPSGGGYAVLYWQIDQSEWPAFPVFSGGTGDMEDPFLISSSQELNQIGCNPRLMQKHFQLSNDINMDGQYYYTIGRKQEPFCGSMSGAVYVIYNLTSTQGLFGMLGPESHVYSVILDNVNIEVDDSEIGGIVGYCSGSTIENCIVNGIINTSSYSGGIAGLCENSIIRTCYTNVDITGAYYTGGLVGHSQNNSISECYTRGQIKGTSHVGGLIGRMEHGIVSDSYSIADINPNVTTSSGYPFGGLIGSIYYGGTVQNCLASGKIGVSPIAGGLVGNIYSSPDEIINSFWDIETTGLTDGQWGEGKSTAELYSSITFVSSGWDFDSIWTILEGYSYPYLRCFPIPAPLENVYLEPENGILYLDPTNETILTWRTGSGITSQNVYFGTDNSPPLVSNQTEATYNCGTLEYGKTYYWRIDGSGPGGITEGPVWSFSTIPWRGAGEQEDPYLIEDADDLYGLSFTPGKSGAYFVLSNDIDMMTCSEPNFMIAEFSGTFEGNNKTIHNFAYQSQVGDVENIGLFGKITGTIKNLNLNNFLIESNVPNTGALAGYMPADGTIQDCNMIGVSVVGTDYVGGLVGINNGEIQNVTLADIQVSGSGNYVGGLVGSATTGGLSNCVIETCSISGNNFVGGLAGKNRGVVVNCTTNGSVNGIDNIGGLVGENHSTDIEFCSTDASVFGETRVGGLIGYNYAATINDSLSSGSIQGKDYVGGLCGHNRAQTIFEVINNCYSTSTVNGDNYIGGLIGYNISNIYSSFATGNVQGEYNYIGGLIGYNYDTKINDSYALGIIIGKNYVGGLIGYNITNGRGVFAERCFSTGCVTGSGNYIGGLIGLNELGEVSDCFWDVQTSTKTTSAGGTGKTTVEMMSGETFANWICSENWIIDAGVDYPHLEWENATGIPLSEGWFSGGSGSPEDPYLLETAEQLNRIGMLECSSGAHFKQIADIDLSGYDGQDGRPSFNLINGCGGFDGNGYRILNFTYNNLSSTDHIGFFRRAGSNINNVKLINVHINAPASDYVGALAGEGFGPCNCSVKGGSVYGSRFVGGLVGKNSMSPVLNCYANINVSGQEYIGGLIGNNFSEDIEKSYAVGSVTGNNRVGGLVGEHSYDTVSECYATGNVYQTGSSPNFHGGLIGYVRGSFARINNSFSIGNATGRYYVGGLVGSISDGYINNCYASGIVTSTSTTTSSKGGLTGGSSASVSNSFWDTQASGITTSYGGIGITTTAMRNPDTFISTGWDFIQENDNGMDEVWRLCNTGSEYPQLNWKYPTGDFHCPNGVAMEDFSFFAERWLCDAMPADLNDNDVVDIEDFMLFCESWLVGIE